MYRHFSKKKIIKDVSLLAVWAKVCQALLVETANTVPIFFFKEHLFMTASTVVEVENEGENNEDPLLTDLINGVQ